MTCQQPALGSVHSKLLSPGCMVVAALRYTMSRMHLRWLAGVVALASILVQNKESSEKRPRPDSGTHALNKAGSPQHKPCQVA